MSADVILAAISAADLCIQSGNRLVNLYKDLKSSDDYVKENILLVEAFMSRTTMQVDVIKRVAHVLSEEHCRIQFEVFEMLQSKLLIAVTKLESVTNKGAQKLKLLFLKESINEVLEQIERWQRIFDPSWFLILRISNSSIDTELANELDGLTLHSRSSTQVSMGDPTLRDTIARAQTFRNVIQGTPNAKIHISLPQDGLDWKNAAAIQFSGTKIVGRNGSSKRYLVDTILCDSNTDISSARADAEALAKKLSQSDTTSSGLLTCYGLVKRKSQETRRITSLDLVFLMPTPQDAPVTLRQHLLHSEIFSLTDALALSRQLARAVSFVHACNFVHKNIRPETILMFSNKTSPKSLGSAYLLGFDSFRSINFHTLLRGDTAWEINLYRHPSRQGRQAQDKYSMQHDVYSLGVCMLEIGLWTSFVHHDEKINPGEALGLTEDDFRQTLLDSDKPYSWIKDHLVSLAQSKLPMKVGDMYTQAVVTCLTCLDKDNPDFGDDSEMEDEDGVLVGVRFINKVLLHLDKICL